MDARGVAVAGDAAASRGRSTDGPDVEGGLLQAEQAEGGGSGQISGARQRTSPAGPAVDYDRRNDLRRYPGERVRAAGIEASLRPSSSSTCCCSKWTDDPASRPGSRGAFPELDSVVRKQGASHSSYRLETEAAASKALSGTGGACPHRAGASRSSSRCPRRPSRTPTPLRFRDWQPCHPGRQPSGSSRGAG